MDTTVTSLREPRWATVLRGVLILIFGLVVLAWPGLTLVTLDRLIGLFVLTVGAVELFGGVLSIGSNAFSWLKLLTGLLEIVLGVYLLRHVGLTLHLLILLFGLALMARGVIELAFALNRKIAMKGKGLLAAVGIFSIIAGIIIVRYPLASGLAWIWVLGIYALIVGPVTIVMGLSADKK